MLIAGVAGLVIHLILLTLKPGIIPRTASTIIIIALFLIIGIGLVLVSVSTGGQSLHTGG